MRRHNPLRWLPLGILIAALQALSQEPAGPVPGTLSLPAPHAATPPSLPTPSSVLPGSPGDLPMRPAVQPATAPQVQLSPEEDGDLMQVQKRYQVAIADYKKVKPATAGVWNKMGISYQMMFNLKDAQRCYKESIKLDPRNATTVNNLATTYDSMKQYKQAEKMYRKALKIEPKSAIIHKNLGTNLLTQHKYNQGLEAYKQAMAIDPGIFQDRNSPRVSNPANVQDRGAMNYYMALGCLRSGQTDCALEYLRNALNEGYVTPKKLAADDQFLSLRDNPAFQQLLTDQQQKQEQKPQ
jgi:tetratricopeptide (TPR) repeat protein